HESKRVKRSKDAIVEFGAELAGLRLEHRVVGVGQQQLPEVAFADRVVDDLRSAGELRQVEGIAVEDHDARVALLLLMPMYAAVLKHEKAAAFILQDLAFLGD